VEDCDAPFNRAVAAGAQTGNGPMGQVADQFWAIAAECPDPQGYRWTIATHKKDLTPRMQQRMKSG
jgi:uncharacterized glyoxalase superfamily protein PhnB